MYGVIKALTIRQPWASLIMSGQKDVENRSWLPPKGYRGKVLVHAGLARNRADDEQYRHLLEGDLP